MRRGQFVLGTASTLPLVGLAGCSSHNPLVPQTGAGAGFGSQAVRFPADHFFAQTQAAGSCPVGPLLKASLNSITGFPDKKLFALLNQVASGKTTVPQAMVAHNMLNKYANIGNVPKPGYKFSFPLDNGEHFDTSIEWRYLTLSMPLKGGGLVSVMVNFFRNALVPPSVMPSLKPVERQLYSNSVGVTVELPGRPGVHYAWPIYALSGCDVEIGNPPFKMVLGRNFLKGTNTIFPLHMHLEDPGDWSVGRPSCVIDVEVEGTNPYFLQGKDGYVGPQDEDPDFAWYYMSWPQQKVTGTFTLDGVKYTAAAGSKAWMDHQWGGGKQQKSGPIVTGTGWCWFEFQFNGNQSLTCAVPHEPLVGGKLPQFNAGFGTYVDNGKYFLCLVLMQALAYTKSPSTNATYPSAWNLQILPGDLTNPIALVVTPTCTVEPQVEWMMGINEYSEANCTVTAQGSVGTKAVNLTGVGYCEGVGFEDPREQQARQMAYLKQSLT
jgi:predicted secreted hydrolase